MLGKNNPMSNHHNMPMVIAFKDNDLNNPLKLCKAPFEITDFLDSIFGIENHKKHSGRAGNVSKSLRNGNTIVRTSGYVFKTFDTCDKQIQDIVHKDYESNITEEQQGSSINNVFIDMDNVFQCKDKEELRQLQYVSVSRSKNNVYMYQT